MKPVCIIPARSGSKGLKNKNMLYLDNKPLIFHTINAAIDSGCFEKKDIYVSTDSPLYISICKSLGISTILRREELSRDDTTSFEVNEDFLQSFNDDQIFVLLQATSPFRDGEDIKKAMDIFLNNDCENVVSFSKVVKPPILFTTLDENDCPRDIFGVDKGYRRQNTKNLFYPNGAIYISKKVNYLKNRSYFTEKTKAYIMEKTKSLDIDDEDDFKYAIGRIFFDYKKRELRNEEKNRKIIQDLNDLRKNKNVVLGDSRITNLVLKEYDNLSLGGLTLNTALKNIDIILSKEIKKMIFLLGINDLISQYTLDEIKNNIDTFIDKILKSNIELIITSVIYTLFRDSVSNEDIFELNNYLLDISKKKKIKFIDLNEEISENNFLKYCYTKDGLHLNEKGEEYIFSIINKEIIKE